jgi:hypothetical protein
MELNTHDQCGIRIRRHQNIVHVLQPADIAIGTQFLQECNENIESSSFHLLKCLVNQEQA